MAKSVSVEILQQEHVVIYSICESFCKEIEHQLLHLIETENIKLAVPIQYRAKSWASILDKIEQKRFTIKKSITELQDLSGIRIILLFARDVNKAIELLESNFKVIKKYNSEDRLEDDQFGYSSVHLIVELLNEWLKIPTLSKFKGMKLEFQIRTLSQHSWAEASNILQYKQEDNVPKPLKRSISRISALLETVDLEYERLLSERDTYKTEIKEKGNGEIEGVLNVDLLEQILDKYLPKENKEQDEGYSELLSDLQKIGFESGHKLIKLIDEQKDHTFDFEKKLVNKLLEKHNQGKTLTAFGYSVTENGLTRLKKGVFLTHIGLIRYMLEQISGRNLI